MATPLDLGTGVGAVFTTREGGVSRAPYDGFNLAAHVGDEPGRVLANRALLAAWIGTPVDRCCYVRQVHGSAVLTVAGADVGTVAVRDGLTEADALVSDVPGVPLVILVADCVPVLLADADARVVAAVHAGRKGVAAAVVTGAVQAMRARGATRIRALIGPSVCAGCYEVPAAMAAEVEAAMPGTAARSRGGTPSLDLAAGVALQLEQADVIDWSMDKRCTAESPELFSHRRDGVTGRFAAVIWLEQTGGRR